jgi:hypothetical protein
LKLRSEEEWPIHSIDCSFHHPKKGSHEKDHADWSQLLIPSFFSSVAGHVEFQDHTVVHKPVYCSAGPVDVYFTDNLQALEQFLNPAAIRVVNKQAVTSTVVQAQPKTRYYWAVDCYVGSPADPVLGPIFSFLVDNIPPRVDAGADIVTWLQDGFRTGNLDATVTEEDAYL